MFFLILQNSLNKNEICFISKTIKKLESKIAYKKSEGCSTKLY